MTAFATLRTALEWQSTFCRSSGSPFSALVLDQIREGLRQGGPYARAFEPWAEAETRAIFDDAALLRLLAAFHYLALSGKAPALTAIYPPNSLPPSGKLGDALWAAAEAHQAVLAGFMASPPQTNEVNRSLCLVGGFLTVAKETGLPLRCLELGASAGLNMNWDRYAYRFADGAGWGDAASPVQLQGEWEGAAPPLGPALINERLACDQNPIDVADEDMALRLQSYVWPDQTQRLERLRAAIALKREIGGVPDRADAAVWAEAHAHPGPGLATVIYHSVFLQYPPPQTQARIVAAIERAGAEAVEDAPVAWLAMEPDPTDPTVMAVTLRLWPGGALRRLALVHPHGAWVRWLS
jgi:hypothetical protein